MFKNIKLRIIRHEGSVRCAYIGNKRFKDSKFKKEALRRVLEEIDIQGRLLWEKLKETGIYG